MKNNYSTIALSSKTLLFSLVFFFTGLSLFAQAPTAPSINLSISNIDGDRFYVSFTKQTGSGNRRIIVASTSPITAEPVDGADYFAANFGLGNELAPGQFVVYNGTTTGTWLYGLNHSTTYYFRIYEYNGTNFNTEYLTTEFLEGSATTLFPPTDQASSLTFSNITGNAMTVGWTRGNGNGVILVARADNPVEVEPQDLVNYSSWTGAFGTTSTAAYDIGTSEHKVLYVGGGTTASITSLNPNRTYHFAIFEYNGSNGKVYLRPGSKASQLTASTPTVAASNLSYTGIDGDRFYYRFTNGNGARRIVIAKEGSAVTAVPENGVSYSQNITFGSGTEIAPDEFVVYNGTSNQSWLYGLKPGTTYHLAVYEYNGTGTGTFYLTDPYLAGSRATRSHPTVQSSNAFTSSRSNTSINISWTRGNGAQRILIGRKDGPVNVEPQDLTTYSTSSTFGSSWTQIGTGNYGLYVGTGNNVNITNLEPGTNYYFALFEYNGNNAKLYLRPGYQFALETFGERPTLQVSNASYSNIDFNSFDVAFVKGNGSRRLVLARAGSPVDAGPTDFSSYIADNTFGQGDQIGSGNYVVYNDFGENFSLQGLDPATTYHFAFFEYSISEEGELYLSPAYTSNQSSKTIVDLGVSQIISPISICDLNEQETVTIEITNYSIYPINEFQVAYTINAGEPIIENVSGTNTIAGNGKLTYSFLTKANLTVDASYDLRAYTIAEEDVDISNDSLALLLIDEEKPIITTNGDQNVNAEAGLCSAAVTVSATATDNCSVGDPVGVRSDGALLTDPYPVGVTTIAWNVTDINNNVATEIIQTVTVTDTQAPVITTNGDQNVNAVEGLCSATVAVSATATDNCSVGEPVGVRNDGALLTDPYPVGVTTIAWNVTDINNNVATEVIQTVTVTDTQAPVITCPTNISTTVEYGEVGKIITYELPIGADNCGAPTIELISGLASGELFPLGQTTVTYRATDASNNTTECSFTVTVTESGDNEDPVISDCPADISVSNDLGKCSSVVTWTEPAATDNSGSVSMISNYKSGSIFPVGTTEVIYTATDEAGNQSTCSFNVTVTDTENPIVLTRNREFAIDAGGSLILSPSDLDNVSTDNCGILGYQLSQTEFTALDEGENTVTLTVTDVNNNQSSATAIVTIIINSIDPGDIDSDGDGFTPNQGDCNDADATIYPGAPELCDGKDNNCDGTVDEGVQTAYYIDADGDGYGDMNAEAEILCLAPVGYVDNNLDCDDADPLANPENPELCNQDPCAEPIEIVSISSPLDPVQINNSIHVSATVSGEVVEAKWTWDNGEETILAEPFGEYSASYTYSTPGVYQIRLILIDACGNETVGLTDLAVIFDPDGGFITGGGWIWSSKGDYLYDPDAEGRANFGFVAKYRKGKNIVDGNTEFQFRNGNLNFNSTSHDDMSLVIANHKAIYKGKGSINGQEGYAFMVSAIDGNKLSNEEPDKFRIKIWEQNTQEVIYDNQMDAAENEDPSTVISGGSIVIHEPSKGNQNKRDEPGSEEETSNEINESTENQSLFEEITSNSIKIYPNPASQETNIMVGLSKESNVEIRIFDTAGRLVFREESQQEGSFTRRVALNGLSNGLYHVVVKIDQQYLQGRLIKK